MCSRLDRFRSDAVREALNIFVVHQQIQIKEQIEASDLEDGSQYDPEGGMFRSSMGLSFDIEEKVEYE